MAKMKYFLCTYAELFILINSSLGEDNSFRLFYLFFIYHYYCFILISNSNFNIILIKKYKNINFFFINKKN